MATKKPNTPLPECFPCTVRMIDTFAGTLSAYSGNNRDIYLEKPMDYFQKLEKDMQAKHKEKGLKPYIVRYERDTKDHRVFRKATFRYGRRELTFTNTAKLEQRLGERKLSCIKSTSQTAIQQFKINTSADQYTADRQQKWTKAGYKGSFTVINNNGSKSFNGTFKHQKEDKELHIVGVPVKGQLQVKIILTREIKETLYIEDRPETWRMKIHRQMQKDGFKGSLDTRKNAFGKVIVIGKYEKSEKIDNGNMICTVEFYNSNVMPDGNKRTNDTSAESYRPTKKSGNSLIQVRSIAQDDTYTPEFRGRRRTEHTDIQREYERYLRDMRLLDRVQLTQLEIEHIKSQNRKNKVTKEEDKAKRWMQKVLKEKPSWYKADNGKYLETYCMDMIKKGVMTPHEADEFCKQNANANTKL